jgi:hypothetical protein
MLLLLLLVLLLVVGNEGTGTVCVSQRGIHYKHSALHGFSHRMVFPLARKNSG